MKADPVQLDLLVHEICKNASYARMDEGLVRRIAEQEYYKRKSIKEAVKAARSKLHQIGTVYLEGSRDLSLNPLRAQTGIAQDLEAQKAWVTPYLSQHVSTRERQTFIEPFYQRIFEEIAPVQGILDLACGLNPLCRPWMPLAASVPYRAWDVFRDVIAAVNAFFEIFTYAGEAEMRDVTLEFTPQPDETVFLLKTLPCLEQFDKGAGERILQRLSENTLVVSFPARSLGGRNVGMVSHYEDYLQSILPKSLQQTAVISFPNETVYILKPQESQ